MKAWKIFSTDMKELITNQTIDIEPKDEKSNLNIAKNKKILGRKIEKGKARAKAEVEKALGANIIFGLDNRRNRDHLLHCALL